MGMYHVILLFSIVAIIAIYDVVVIMKKGKYNSISAWMIRTSYKYPSVVFIIGFGLGFIAGHLYWEMPDKNVWDNPDTIQIETQKEN